MVGGTKTRPNNVLGAQFFDALQRSIASLIAFASSQPLGPDPLVPARRPAVVGDAIAAAILFQDPSRPPAASPMDVDALPGTVRRQWVAGGRLGSCRLGRH